MTNSNSIKYSEIRLKLWGLVSNLLHIMGYTLNTRP